MKKINRQAAAHKLRNELVLDFISLAPSDFNTIANFGADPTRSLLELSSIDLQRDNLHNWRRGTRPRDQGGNPMSMRISSRQVDDVTILDISGRITLGDETGMLRDAVRDLLGKGTKKIVLNLAEVSYIDSTGVGELVGSLMTVRTAGGDLKLMNLSQKVKDVVHVTKLYTVFDIKEDEFTAVKSFDWFFAK